MYKVVTGIGGVSETNTEMNRRITLTHNSRGRKCLSLHLIPVYLYVVLA